MLLLLLLLLSLMLTAFFMSFGLVGALRGCFLAMSSLCAFILVHFTNLIKNEILLRNKDPQVLPRPKTNQTKFFAH